MAEDGSQGAESKAAGDEVAIITGSASGIGRGTALAFAALNYRLVLVDKNAERLAETGQLCIEKSPRKHKPLELSLDLSTGENVAREVVSAALKQFGQLDVLINNAGITGLTRHDDPQCVDLYHKIIATNMHAVTYLCLAAFEPLKAARGSIVNVSSMLDDKPAKYKFAYCMSKAGVTMLTKCLANDFGPFVRVNAVSPGPVASSILDDMGINSNERESNAKNTTLVGRIGRPEEVAKMILHLASKEKAAFITGSRVLVDGGYTIRPNSCDSNIKNVAGIKLRGASFLMHQVYDDETTFKLVAAASKVSGLPIEVCLEEFGKHFLVYCQKNGYDQILRVLGGNLYDFLTNLDNLHDHLASIYPGMRAPSFRVTRQLESKAALQPDDEVKCDSKSDGNHHDQQDSTSQFSSGSMYLHYYSERKGLSPIVKGLVLAVAREFFSTEIVVTECKLLRPQLGHADDHVVLKIDRRSQADILFDEQTSQAIGQAAAQAARPHEAGEIVLTSLQAEVEPAEGERRQQRQNQQQQQHHHHKTMLSAMFGDSLSKCARDSLISSEIMMQSFPFHVIFDKQFNLVQVGQSLLRVTSHYWRRRCQRAANTNDGPVKFSDLFSIVRPKIEFTFDAIADHTNQVFVVKTGPLVLNADYLRQQRAASKQSSPLASAGSGRESPPGVAPDRPGQGGRPPPSLCPMNRIAQKRRSCVAKLADESEPDRHDTRGRQDRESSAGEPRWDLAGSPVVLSLRLKGQMIVLSGADVFQRGDGLPAAGSPMGPPYCLYLCSPRVDHLDQLLECGATMSDLALHDRARELMLMSHTHKEDREAVKKLDQATNDLKKMDTKLRQENKRTNEVLHNIFPAKIATLLSHGAKIESESFDPVTCLYSDIIGFTKMCGSENVRPIDIVRLLNTLYLQFDNLTNIHGVYKVETIGDAYVIVGGLPEPVEDHADRCVRMGLDMVKVIATVRSPADNQPIQMRIGIHSGPVMAGIVGIRVPRYSLFGNTTTLANQLETHGQGGKIHISDFTLKKLIKRERFVIEPNPSQLPGFPFKTHFVTDYLSDRGELLEHEKILEEQLLKDFEMMGSEVELVDDSTGRTRLSQRHSGGNQSKDPVAKANAPASKPQPPADPLETATPSPAGSGWRQLDRASSATPVVLMDVEAKKAIQWRPLAGANGLERQRKEEAPNADIVDISNKLCDVILSEALSQAAGLQRLDRTLLALLMVGCRQLLEVNPLFASTKTAAAIISASASALGIAGSACDQKQKARAALKLLHEGRPAGSGRDCQRQRACPLCDGLGKLNLSDASCEPDLLRLVANLVDSQEAEAQSGAMEDGKRAGRQTTADAHILSELLVELREERKRLEAQVSRMERLQQRQQSCESRIHSRSGQLEPLLDEEADDPSPLSRSASQRERSVGPELNVIPAGLSSSIQRMKRMDTLKRRKIKRDQQQQVKEGAGNGRVAEGPVDRADEDTDDEPHEQQVDHAGARRDGKLISVQQFIKTSTNSMSSPEELKSATKLQQANPRQQQARPAAIYQTFRASLANLMSETVQSGTQLQRQEEAANRKKRFSLSAFSSSVSAAISSPFSSPRKCSSQAATQISGGVRKPSGAPSQSSSSGGQANSSARTTPVGGKRHASRESGHAASNCSCLKSSPSSASIEPDQVR